MKILVQCDGPCGTTALASVAGRRPDGWAHAFSEGPDLTSLAVPAPIVGHDLTLCPVCWPKVFGAVAAALAPAPVPVSPVSPVPVV